MTQNLNRQSFRNIFPPFLKNMYENKSTNIAWFIFVEILSLMKTYMTELQ